MLMSAKGNNEADAKMLIGNTSEQHEDRESELLGHIENLERQVFELRWRRDKLNEARHEAVEERDKLKMKVASLEACLKEGCEEILVRWQAGHDGDVIEWAARADKAFTLLDKSGSEG